MTVVCYKNGVLASDSLVSNSIMNAGSMQKVLKRGGYLVGVSGSCKDAAMFLDAVKEIPVEALDNFIPDPVTMKFDNLGAIFVKPDGTVLHVDEGGYFFQIDAPFHAEGSGAPIAIGAMAAGASAQEAVEIAIEYVPSCGGKVQSVELDKKVKRKR